MKTTAQKIMTGNEAAAYVAFKTNDICAVYPITPATNMAVYVEEKAANVETNIFGDVPQVMEMQSEAGVAGMLHGALQTGSLATTFTASQGLLLMIPNMYKMAGELTPHVIHVATRTVATHALSVFCDHSDVMAVRNTGYAQLTSANVQEAMDFALIAQAASLKSRIPFIHFFDGFRTSHEYRNIKMVDDETIEEMMDIQKIEKHKARALNPYAPVIRGTAQGSDTFFQSKEAINPFYKACPNIVQTEMDKLYALTGRRYQLFEYVGHAQAEQVIVCMASATETIEETVGHLLEHGEKVGLLKVRLYRPFSMEHFINAIPKTCKTIGVLDKTKEPGSLGEPLYLDTVQAFFQAHAEDKTSSIPKIVGGRYGLSSKEFTPAMVKAVFDNLKNKTPKNNFTIGIHDDVTHSSLPYKMHSTMENTALQAILIGAKNIDTENSFKELLEQVSQTSSKSIQGFNEVTYDKAGSKFVSYLRINEASIKSEYLIETADAVFIEAPLLKVDTSWIKKIKTGGELHIIDIENGKPLNAYLSVNSLTELYNRQIAIFQYSKDENKKINSALVPLHQPFLVYYKRQSASKREALNHHHFVETDAQTKVELPVSACSVDGTFKEGNSHDNPIMIMNDATPTIDLSQCTQCGVCSLVCPQAALQMKLMNEEATQKAPKDFAFIEADEKVFNQRNMYFTLQLDAEHCTGCGLCVDYCETAALRNADKKEDKTKEKNHWQYFESLPNYNRIKIDVLNIAQQQLQAPLFKYAHSEQGCAQTPYLKLLSQLFGDRLLVANATGSSSIFGGMASAIPWYKDDNGRGPAWSNSLFEDAAEFGLGFRLSANQQRAKAIRLLQKHKDIIGEDLVNKLINASQKNDTEIAEQRNRIETVKIILEFNKLQSTQELLDSLDDLVEKSIWVVGGDGWAYDIGFGGIDHVLASSENVNMLVLDNQAYSNTGGQMSKATPFGAKVNLASKGKRTHKKDLGVFAIQYEDVYVASICLGADPQQTLKAITEAENYPGPSIIIAYCHSPSHGIKEKNLAKHYKDTITSGHWVLYRNDPKRILEGKIPLQIDSKKPSKPLSQFLIAEKRFESFMITNKCNASLHKSLEVKTENTYNQLQSLQTYKKSFLA